LGGIIISLFLNILSIAYLLANSLVSDDMLNFTLATLLKFVATGPGQNMDIFTFDG
jgi:hypothetical protein